MKLQLCVIFILTVLISEASYGGCSFKGAQYDNVQSSWFDAFECDQGQEKFQHGKFSFGSPDYVNSRGVYPEQRYYCSSGHWSPPDAVTNRIGGGNIEEWDVSTCTK